MYFWSIVFPPDDLRPDLVVHDPESGKDVIVVVTILYKAGE